VLTEEEVRHVAMLARLGLSDEEVGRMREQLGQVLGYIDALQKIDTSQVAPTAQVGGHADVMRPDEPRPSFPDERVLANAPASEEPYFKVPAVLDDNAPDLGGHTGG
jgi:aspartyl-tRNA(Asn)/glutamyl-tRNA(Gln) amidotransferase subunit C